MTEKLLLAHLEAQPPETAPTPLDRCTAQWPLKGGQCVLREGHGAIHVYNSDMAAPTPDPPAETPTPPMVDDCGTRVVCNLPGQCAFHANRPADTTTGLAPLITMNEGDDVTVCRLMSLPLAEWLPSDHDWWSRFGYAKRFIAEIDAQRQASASVRREAIEECMAIVRRESTDMPNRSTETCRTPNLLRDFEALREPRVSPRQPSGGGQ